MFGSSSNHFHSGSPIKVCTPPNIDNALLNIRDAFPNFCNGWHGIRPLHTGYVCLADSFIQATCVVLSNYRLMMRDILRNIF